MKHAMVVDDSGVIRKVARAILEGLAFDTCEAEDGVAALFACEQRMPEVILLDWNMPQMDGVGFLRALRKMPNGGAPRVIYCGIENDRAQIAEAMRAGADAFLLKPFDRRTLLSKLSGMGLA